MNIARNKRSRFFVDYPWVQEQLSPRVRHYSLHIFIVPYNAFYSYKCTGVYELVTVNTTCAINSI